MATKSSLRLVEEPELTPAGVKRRWTRLRRMVKLPRRTVPLDNEIDGHLTTNSAVHALLSTAEERAQAERAARGTK